MARLDYKPPDGTGRWNPNGNGGDLQVLPVIRCRGCGAISNETSQCHAPERCHECPPSVSIVGEWWEDGNCKEPDDATPDAIRGKWALFFKEAGNAAPEAKALCLGATARQAVQLGLCDPDNPQPIPECPVLAECRAYAVRHAVSYGIWGGMSERERRRERSKQRQATIHAEPQRVEYPTDEEQQQAS